MQNIALHNRWPSVMHVASLSVNTVTYSSHYVADTMIHVTDDYFGPNELGKQTQWKEDKIENAKTWVFTDKLKNIR